MQISTAKHGRAMLTMKEVDSGNANDAREMVGGEGGGSGDVKRCVAQCPRLLTGISVPANLCFRHGTY